MRWRSCCPAEAADVHARLESGALRGKVRLEM
jgi:hypothetical protein